MNRSTNPSDFPRWRVGLGTGRYFLFIRPKSISELVFSLQEHSESECLAFAMPQQRLVFASSWK